MLKYLFTLLLLLTAGLSFGQGWEHLYGGGGSDAANDLAATPDGGYILAGSYSNFKLFLVKVDPDGDEQWVKTYTANGTPNANAVISSRDTGIVTAGYLKNSKRDIYLFKTDAYGAKKWSKTFGSPSSDEEAFDLLELSDGSLIVVGSGGINNNLIILKTDAQGNQIWYQTYGLASEKEQGYGITLMSNGDLVAVGAKNESLGYVLRVDGATGNQIWEHTYDFNTTGFDIIKDVVATPEGDLLLAGFSNSTGLIAKVDGSGDNIIWSKIISGPDPRFNGIALANDGGFFVSGLKNNSSNTNGVLVINRFDPDGTQLWEAVAGKGGPAEGYRVLATPDGGAITAGISLTDITGLESRAYLVKSDAFGQILSSYIKGSIFWDKVSLNNQLDPGEPGLGGWIAVVSNPNNPLDSLFIVSRDDGSFQVAVNPGTYNITLYRTSDYWQSNQVTVEVPVGEDTVIANVPVRTAFDCPRNQVDVATPILRRCVENIFTVRYCNTGTTPSQGTYVEVTLDPFLTVTGSSAPYTQTGDVLRFNVGNVNTGDCGNFTFNAFLDCNSTLSGQTHCVSAHIYPDTFCNIGTWDRSIVEAIAKCDGDSVRMYLKNKGIGNMSVESDFVIAEDVIMLVRPDNPLKFKLNAGEIDTVWAHAKTGSTYRIIANQTPGYPGFSRPTAAVEGCKSDTSMSNPSLGFYTMFPEDDKDAFVSAHCQESVESDFNPILFKRGHPKGYDVPHYVSPQTDLEFLIQFLNTGMDTVQQIIVRDTLSAALNPASIVPGASSHPYQFSVYGNNIVEFIITDANLLPQGTESEGFVKFRVAQRPNLPCNTEILNTAEITFDFNAPKFTNETFHTVCNPDSFLILATKDLQWKGADLRIYPNPFEESALIEVQGVQSNSFELSLYDTQGRLLSNQVYAQPTFRLYRHQIPAGIIFYRLTSHGKPVATGKLIAK